MSVILFGMPEPEDPQKAAPQNEKEWLESLVAAIKSSQSFRFPQTEGDAFLISLIRAYEDPRILNPKWNPVAGRMEE